MNNHTCGHPSERTATADGDPVPPDSTQADHIIASEELLNGRKEVMIRHDGEVYRLRRTSKGKLIMTK